MMKKSPGIVFLIEQLIDAVVILVSIILVNIVLLSLSGLFSDILVDVMGRDMINLPSFDYYVTDGGDGGNAMFDVYSQFRWIVYILMAAGIMVAVAVHVAMGHSKFWKQKILSIIVTILVVAAFPYVWDVSSNSMELFAGFVMNENFSTDMENPCPKHWSDQDIIDNFNDSPYNHGDSTWTVEHAKRACLPDWKVNYLIQQIADDQEYKSGIKTILEDTNTNPLQWISLNFLEFFSEKAAGISTMLFFSFVKSIVTIQAGMLMMIIAVLTDMLTSMVIAGLPVLLVLRMIPMFAKTADRLLFSLPPLFLLPMFSAVIITVGAAVVASTHTFPAASGYLGPISMALIYVWISSVGVLFLAVALPVIFVPALSDVFRMVSTTVTTAVQASLVIASNAAMAGVRGVAGSMKGGAGMGKGLGGGGTVGLGGGGDKK